MEWSALEIAYQAAKELVAQGKLDADRLQRGYELAQDEEFLADISHYHGYTIDVYGCTCLDSVSRNVTCKHSIAHTLVIFSKEIS
jgi:hypothetical protein